jgi:hypothetical protein
MGTATKTIAAAAAAVFCPSETQSVAFVCTCTTGQNDKALASARTDKTKKKSVRDERRHDAQASATNGLGRQGRGEDPGPPARTKSASLGTSSKKVHPSNGLSIKGAIGAKFNGHEDHNKSRMMGTGWVF